MKRFLLVSILSVLMLFISLPAFASKGKVKIAYVEWACATASSNVVAATLQEKMGYEVELIPVSAAAMWQAVAEGDVDAMVTAWLPVTHKDYYESVKDDVVNLGPLQEGAKLCLVVPDYVDINSVAEINEHAEKFDNRIVGIDPGAGLMKRTEQALKDYNMNKIELMEGSDAVMAAALGDAIDNKEWIVVTGWSPHWMFGRWDVRCLEDPKGTFGGEEYIATIVRKGLDKDMPDVYRFLDNFSWSPAQIGQVMNWNQEDGADPYENAVRYINENPEQVESWIP